MKTALSFRGRRAVVAGAMGALVLAVATGRVDRLVDGLPQPLNLDTLLEARSPGGRPAGALTQTKERLASSLVDGPAGPSQRVLPMLRPPAAAVAAPLGEPGLGVPVPGAGPLIAVPPIDGVQTAGGAGPDVGSFPFAEGPPFVGPGFGPGGGGGGGGGGPPGNPDQPDTPTQPNNPDLPGNPDTPLPPVTPVPEPGMWLMMIAATGMIGGMARRKRMRGLAKLARHR